MPRPGLPVALGRWEASPVCHFFQDTSEHTTAAPCAAGLHIYNHSQVATPVTCLISITAKSLVRRGPRVTGEMEARRAGSFPTALVYFVFLRQTTTDDV